MNIEIIRTYPEDDLEFSEDALDVELIVDGKSILKGDWYHDHIDDRIEGFFEALDFLKIAYEHHTNNKNFKYEEEND